MSILEEIKSNTVDGDEMYALAKRLFPICRSITGNGVRETLGILKEFLPGLKIAEVASGTQSFDWTVPLEWNIKDAYIIDPDGNKIVSFQDSNLHVVSYSIPVDGTFTLEELDEHLYSLPDKPETIPYVTSYYNPRWGFCLRHKQRKNLKKGLYKVRIDSELKKGSLTYGELIIPGEEDKELFLSTYICHPSLGNNELSGPVVTTQLAKHILKRKNRYTYRIIFIPETIGSITYLSRNFKKMKDSIIAGFNITCVGDNNNYSYLPSRKGDTLADKMALHVLHHYTKEFKKYTYLDRGSDERQYCSPGVDLPIATIMRSKYGEYSEYHTSDDNLDFISAEGLLGAFDIIKKSLLAIEYNNLYAPAVFCEPQLGKRGLYETLNFHGKQTMDIQNRMLKTIIDFIAYCDGVSSLLEIAEIINTPIFEVVAAAQVLLKHNLIRNKQNKEIVHDTAC